MQVIIIWMQLYRICLSKKTNIRQECKKYKENKCVRIEQRIKKRIQGVKWCKKYKEKKAVVESYPSIRAAAAAAIAQLDDSDHLVNYYYRQMMSSDAYSME